MLVQKNRLDASWGRLGGLLGRLGGILKPLGGVLGQLGRIVVPPGPSWRRLGAVLGLQNPPRPRRPNPFAEVQRPLQEGFWKD